MRDAVQKQRSGGHALLGKAEVGVKAPLARGACSASAAPATSKRQERSTLDQSIALGRSPAQRNRPVTCSTQQAGHLLNATVVSAGNA
jgi:hypothetical protein